MPNEKNFELISYEGISFMGIDKSQPVFIDFTKMRKNQGFTELAGKQGKRKTSTLNGIAYSLGARFNLDKKRLINTVDGEIDEATIFKWDGEKYKIEVSTDRIAIKRSVNGEEKWTPKGIDKPPLEFINDVFGRVMFIPFHEKNMKGKELIEFFQQTFGSGEDASKKMQKLEAAIDELFYSRRDVNKEIKNLDGALKVEPLYQNYEKTQERFKNAPNPVKEKAKFDELSEKSRQFTKAQDVLKNYKDDLKYKQQEIEELKAKLAVAEKEAASVEKRIETGQKWLQENKGVPQEFQKANEAWLNLSREMAEYEKWKVVLKQEKQLNEKQELTNTATAQLDELRVQLLKLTKQCLPKVEGLTIKVATGLDTADKPHGVFYVVPGKKEEQALHELSESEYADMWCKILEAEDAQFVFIENITSFGDNVVNTLNQFVKNGGHVLYTVMDRKLNELGITFKSKID